MKLLECLKLAYVCGLLSVQEAYHNVYLHSTQLFKYEDIADEIEELERDMMANTLGPDDSVEELLLLFGVDPPSLDPPWQEPERGEKR